MTFVSLVPTSILFSGYVREQTQWQKFESSFWILLGLQRPLCLRHNILRNEQEIFHILYPVCSLQSAFCTDRNVYVRLSITTAKTTTRSYFSAGNSVSFPEGYIKSEKGWAGFWYFAQEKSLGVGRFVQMRCFTPHWSTQLPDFTHFECIYLWYFPSTLPYRSEVLPYIGHMGMSSLKGYEKYGLDFGHFCPKLGMGFHSRLELGTFFKKKLLFSSLTMRPATKAVHNTFNIILN